MALIALFVFCGICAALIYFSQHSKTRGSWIQFFSRGTDAGFSLREIELLKNLAVKSDLREPASIFGSLDQLDLCIRTLVKERKNGTGEDTGDQNFLSKLYEYRKKLEMEKPGSPGGISNSRQISEGQNLRILVPGIGVFRSQMIRNSSESITVSRPVNEKISSNFSWIGTKISVYFWRENDAGYAFDSEAVDEVFSKGLSSLKLVHADSLYRTQKRKSIRIKMNKPAYLYLLAAGEAAGKMETAPGVNCLLEDLSDSGCAVVIGGQVAPGIRIKVQFALNGAPICMSGAVRSVDYKESLQRSLLHVEADPLPLYAQNMIMGEIFGTGDCGEEDLPYRIPNSNSAPVSNSADAAGMPDLLPETPKNVSSRQAPLGAAGSFADPPNPAGESPPPDSAAGKGLSMGMISGGEPSLVPFPPEGDVL
jgi:hypothetical protein